MHYELYADSLFLMNFGMNLYLLFLVNYSTMRTSGGWRLLLGAGYGSLCYFILFLGGLSLFLRILAGGILGTVGMILIAFPVKHFRDVSEASGTAGFLFLLYGWGYAWRCFGYFPGAEFS